VTASGRSSPTLTSGAKAPSSRSTTAESCAYGPTTSHPTPQVCARSTPGASGSNRFRWSTSPPPSSPSTGSDTNADGEACEPGRGYSERSGFWDPDRSYWRVHEHRAGVTPDVYPDGEPRSPARWLVDQLSAWLGAVESFDHGRSFYGAAEAVYPGRLTDLAIDPSAADPTWGHTVAAIRARIAKRGQRTLTAAGHAHGFTDDQLADAAALLGLG